MYVMYCTVMVWYGMEWFGMCIYIYIYTLYHTWKIIPQQVSDKKGHSLSSINGIIMDDIGADQPGSVG